MSSNRISVDGLRAGYGKTVVLDGVSYDFHAGRCVGLLGPNGAGKTTWLRCMAGLLPVSGGTVRLGEQDAGSLDRRERARQVALIRQQTAPAMMSVWETVCLGRVPHYLGRSFFMPAADEAIVTDALRQADAWHLREKRLDHLSGGERQLVYIAKALAQRPSVLLCDEPVSNLDLSHQLRVYELLRHYAAVHGAVVIAALHDINNAAVFCDELVFLQAGRVLAAGTPRRVMTSRRLKQLYGVDVVCTRDADQVPVVRFKRTKR